MHMDISVAVIIGYCCYYNDRDIQDDAKYHGHVVTTDGLGPIYPKPIAQLLLQDQLQVKA